MTTRTWFFALLAVLLLLALIGLVMLAQGHGELRVTVGNAGTSPLRSVVIHVTGASYPLGDIVPGSSVETTVNPRGESHLEITFSDSSGNTKRLNAGGYFESGYHGKIYITLKDGIIEKNEQQIEP